MTELFKEQDRNIWSHCPTRMCRFCLIFSSGSAQTKSQSDQLSQVPYQPKIPLRLLHNFSHFTTCFPSMVFNGTRFFAGEASASRRLRVVYGSKSFKMFLLGIFLHCYVFPIRTQFASGHRVTGPAFVGIKRNPFGKPSEIRSATNLFFDNDLRRVDQISNSTDIGLHHVVSKGKPPNLENPKSSLPNVYSAVNELVEDTDGQDFTSTRSYKIYCDMDGCLVNFEKGVRTLLKTGTSNLDKRIMWEGIARSPLWFEELEWQMDGRRLWSAIKHLNPDILTGVPNIQSSKVEKFNWCKRELGIEAANAHHVDMAADGGLDHKSVNGNLPRDDKTNIITCWSNNKYKECNRHGSILIDDRIDLKDDWEAAGGIFIHHINTETTIRQLRDLGIISKGGLDNGERDWYWEGSWRLWTNEEDGSES